MAIGVQVVPPSDEDSHLTIVPDCPLSESTPVFVFVQTVVMLGDRIPPIAELSTVIVPLTIGLTQGPVV